MAFVTPATTTRVLPVLLAFLALVLAGALSLLTINVWQRGVTFYLLPLLVVALWPRGVSGVLSVVSLFIGGLWLDWVTQGASGHWSLIFLIYYAVMRPHQHPPSLSFGAAFLSWGVAVLLGLAALGLTGRGLYGIWPDWAQLVWQAGLATLFLPILWGIRVVVGRLISDPDEWAG